MDTILGLGFTVVTVMVIITVIGLIGTKSNG
jgi:hypothetical protein